MPTALQASRPPTGSLPFDVLVHVFAYLDDPLDLYRSSLVSKVWRAASTSSKSWEDAYWHFYRPSYAKDDKQRAILAARTRKRRGAMRAWLQTTANCPPTYDSADRLLKEADVPEDSMRELLRSMCHGKDLEGVSPYTRTEIMAPLAGLATQPVPLPHFLRLTAPLPQTNVPSPDFHALFVSRLNRDQRLLNQLVDCAQLGCGTLEAQVSLIEEHGDDARELLSAICATQRATSAGLQQAFDPKGDFPLRAYHLHSSAAQGVTLPHPKLFLTLRFLVEEMLSYLQRRDAIKSLKGLTARAESRGEGNENSTAHQAAFRGCKGVEEAYEDFALFFSGDRVQNREYLDLLALFVWAELQAQDRRTSLDGTIYGPTPHRKLLPLGTTRHLSARISHILRALGFGSAPPHQQKDFANNFLHASLFCPTQRVTSELTAASIACFVMRRLGVSATPQDTPHRHYCFAVEDTPQAPAGWAGPHCNKLWQYFYLDPTEVESRLIAEADEVQKFLFSMCVFEQAYLSPCPPRNIALRLAVKLITVNERGTTTSSLGEIRSASKSRGAKPRKISPAPMPQGPLAILRHYLEGRQAAPPDSLPPATLASSLSFLPPTTLNAPRLEPMHRREEVNYAAHWYLSILQPTDFGGPRKSEEKLCTLLAPWLDEGQHLLDPFLKMETSNAPSPALRRLKHTLAAKDKVGSEGVGGYGGGGEVKKGRAHWSEEEKQQRLGRSAWPEVKYGVGTLFKHRKTGKAGVVVGWDSERRNAKELREGIEMDTAPYGPTQPHYHAIDEEGTMRYVAQANVRPASIAPGSSPQEIVQQLKGFDKLLGVSKIGRCFRTLRVEEAKGAREGEEEERRFVLVMNEWMKGAWPFD